MADTNDKPGAVAVREQQQVRMIAPPSNPWGLGLMSDGLLDIISTGRVLHQAGYFKDIKSASQGIVKAMLGRELGITAIQAVMNIHIVKERAMVGSDILAQKIRMSKKYDYDLMGFKVERDDKGQPKPNSYIKIKFWKLDPKDPTRKIEFPDEEKGVVTWTIADAHAAKLGAYKGGGFDSDSAWFKTPRNMLFARAIADGRRWYCPDIFDGPSGGVYIPDEMGFRTNATGDIDDTDDAFKAELAANQQRADEASRNASGTVIDAAVEQQPGAGATVTSQPERKPDPINTSERGKVIAWKKKHKWDDDELRRMLKAACSYIDVALADISDVVAQLDKVDHERVLEIIEAGPKAWAESQKPAAAASTPAPTVVDPSTPAGGASNDELPIGKEEGDGFFEFCAQEPGRMKLVRARMTELGYTKFAEIKRKDFAALQELAKL